MNTKLLLILVLVFGTIGLVWGQSTGDYQTRYTGARNWNTASNWQRFDGFDWQTAGSVPNSSNAGVIRILNGASITVNANINADQLVVDSGGVLTVAETRSLTIANGSGTDFTVNGSLSVVGSVSVNSGATMVVNNTIIFTGSSTVSGAGAFSLSANATLETKNLSGLTTGSSGSVQTSTISFSTGANYTYSASDAQMNTGSALPSSVNRLTVDAGAGLVLTNDVTITTELIFASGWLVLGNNDIVFGNGATVNGAAWLYYNGTGHVVDLDEADTIEIEYQTPHELPPYVNNVILRDNVVLPNDIIVETVDYVEYYLNLNGYKVTCDIKSIAFSGNVKISATDLDMEEVSQSYGSGTSIEMTWTTGGYVTDGTLTIDFRYPEAISPGSPVKVWRRIEGSSDAWQQVGTTYVPIEGDPMVVVVSGVTSLMDDDEVRYQWTISGESETLPIELSSFSATVINNGKVRLDWITLSETGVNGYYLLRGRNANMSNAFVVSPLILATNTSSQTVYAFEDREIPESGTYYYWLQHEFMNGAITYHGPTIAEVTDGSGNIPLPPTVTALNKPYPNPFNPTLNISYSIASPALVKLDIYNSRGQLVNSIFDGQKQAGNYITRWNGKDLAGNSVSTGTYFVRMSAGKYESTQKVVLIK